MEMSHSHKDSAALNSLFSSIMTDLKSSGPIWEDFISKSGKLHGAMKLLLQATSAFLESFQKVADLATNSHGATREIGATLTRLCMRQRSIDGKLKVMTNHIMGSLAMPMQDRLEDWKKATAQLDKDRLKDIKRAKNNYKKASSESIRLQKKAKKGKCPSSLQTQVERAMQGVSDKYRLIEEAERVSVRRALVEERSRFCYFISCLKPMMECEISMVGEISTLEELVKAMTELTTSPQSLPADSEAVLTDMRGTQAPRGSLSEMGSRKSSVASISSASSSNSAAGSGAAPSPAHHPVSKQPMTGSLRLSTLSSQDSGFTSQDTVYLQGMQVLKSRDYMRQSAPAEADGGADDGGGGSGEGSGASSIDESDTEEDSEDAVTPSSPPVAGWANGPKTPGGSDVRDSGGGERHTISSAYERAGQHNRPALSAFTFELPNKSKTGSCDSGVDASAPVLYPNQALPPPMYANLSDLAHAAKRKYSIPTIPSQAMSGPDPSRRMSSSVMPPPPAPGPGRVVRRVGESHQEEEPVWQRADAEAKAAQAKREDLLGKEIEDELDKVLAEVNAIADRELELMDEEEASRRRYSTVSTAGSSSINEMTSSMGSGSPLFYTPTEPISAAAIQEKYFGSSSTISRASSSHSFTDANDSPRATRQASTVTFSQPVTSPPVKGQYGSSPQLLRSATFMGPVPGSYAKQITPAPATSVSGRPELSTPPPRPTPPLRKCSINEPSFNYNYASLPRNMCLRASTSKANQSPLVPVQMPTQPPSTITDQPPAAHMRSPGPMTHPKPARPPSQPPMTLPKPAVSPKPSPVSIKQSMMPVTGHHKVVRDPLHTSASGPVLGRMLSQPPLPTGYDEHSGLNHPPRYMPENHYGIPHRQPITDHQVPVHVMTELSHQLAARQHSSPSDNDLPMPPPPEEYMQPLANSYTSDPLLNAIRGGVRLRPTESIRDRSAPAVPRKM